MKRNLFLFMWLAFTILPVIVFSQCSYTLSTIVTNVTCYNGTNGSITINVTGGTAPYQYQLSEASAGGWVSANVFSALAANTYPVSVKDATGCIKTVYLTVTQPAPLVAGYTSVDPTCSGSTNGSITITPSGGAPPYTYSWLKNGTAFSTAQNLTGLSSGNYLLTLTDANGCTAAPIINSQVKTIGVTGFNEDVVADGSTVAASSATSHSIDQSPGNVYYASGYTNGSGVSGSGGLPASGSFTSAQTSSRPYQLASYSSSNALLLRSSSDNANGGAVSGTLSFQSQYRSPYATLYVVGTTGSGTGVVNYTVNFSDATTYTGALTFPDWALPAATASSIRALGSLDRISRTSPGTYDNVTNFNLFEGPISIPGGSQSKEINSIDFSWSSSGSARINLFAVTGYTSTTSGIRINDGPAASVTPSVSVSSDATSNQFCSGQSVVFTATPINGGSTPSYQWKLNGTNVGTNSPSYTNSSLNNNDLVTVVMTASGGVSCLSTPTANGNTITMTLAPKTATVTTAASSSNICSGQSVSFTATPSNGGASPSYQWKLNGSNVGTNSPSYSNSSLNNNDQVTVVMTSSIGCATSNPATGNTIAMSVLANGDPTVTITSTPSINFTSSITFGGSTPAYQWYKNGATIGGATSPTYSTGSASLGDIFSLKLTSNYACKTAPSAMSNYITVSYFTLPVTIEYFTLQTQDNKKVILNWKTVSEINNKQFIIQRSTPATVSWQTIGIIAATNASNGSTYSYTDEPGLAGTYLYRIVQEDIDGRQVYTGTRSAVLKKNSYWTVNDNGTNWQLQSSLLIQYKLLDLQGKLIEQGIVNGTTQIAKPVSGAIYLLRIACNGEISTQKLVR